MATQEKSVLNIIRFLLLGWTFALGIAAWYLAQGTGVAPELVQGVEPYVWSGLLLVFLVLFGGVLRLRSRWQASQGVAPRRRMSIMGWALAEAATLLGIAYLYVVGDPSFFSVGFLFQGLASFVLLPVPNR